MKTFLRVLMIIGCCCAVCSARAEDSADFFKGKIVGVQLGTTGDVLMSEKTTVRVERYNKINDAVQSVLKGKIDAVVVDEQPAVAFLKKNKTLTQAEAFFPAEEYAVALAKKNQALKKQINAVLADLKNDGTLSGIVRQYIGDEAGKHPYASPENTVLDKGILRVATNATFPPYEFFDNGKIVGIDIDLAHAIADRLGKKIVVEDMEFDAVIAAVQSGRADVGMAAMTVTLERLKNIDFSNAYARSKQVVLVRGNADENAETNGLFRRFSDDFLEKDRWKYLADGLKNTLLITFFAVIVGIVLGALMAVVRTAHDESGAFRVLNMLCRLYLTTVRATPVMIQLLIIYYVVFSGLNVDKIIVAVLAFGLNSAAYVAEIMRSGISAVPKGQLEAGRSLGFGFAQTMRLIVLPQAFKNILPALANEFITLLKETSICGYIGLVDLTRGGDIIRSVTYDAFLPLAAVALIYLSLVTVLTKGIDVLEQRLKKNER